MITEMYHGCPVDRGSLWLPDRFGEGNCENGPGWYFTDRRTTAECYAGSGGWLYKVTLHLDESNHASDRPIDDWFDDYEQRMIKLAKASRSFRSAMSDWDENPDLGFEQFMGVISRMASPWDAAEQIFVDIYGNQGAAAWAKQVSGILGWDGRAIQKGDEQHAVVWNFDCVSVQSAGKIVR